MRINWKVRLSNVDFWLTLVPALLLLVQAIGTVFGYEWDFIVLNQQSTAIINALFAVLSILGVVNDPTTQTINDSDLAMTYEEPKSYLGGE